MGAIDLANWQASLNNGGGNSNYDWSNDPTVKTGLDLVNKLTGGEKKTVDPVVMDADIYNEPIVDPSVADQKSNTGLLIAAGVAAGLLLWKMMK